LQTGLIIVTDKDGSREYRALFISDVHLGTRGCQAERLLDFLREYDAETIFLVGDIVDGWALRGGWYWPQPHNDVVQKLLRKARKGARIIYVPGNHDEVLRDFYGTHFGGIEVVKNFMHEGADGRRYLVTHGDQFDLVVQNARWLALLGDKAYDFAIGVNLVFNGVRYLNCARVVPSAQVACPPARSSAARTRSGVIGMRVMRTPVALAIALATAAAGGTIGTSPTPRTP
jgi:UDP-2,3-diacylglucosamine pyrophosphatase LpxH